MNLKEMLSKKIRIGLKSIKYDYIGDICEESEINYYDEARAGDITPDYLEVLVTRKVFFEPEDIFNLEVTYYVLHFFDDSIDSLDIPDRSDIDREINEDIEYYTESEQAKVSLLISEITTAFSLNPLITIPVFTEKSE